MDAKISHGLLAKPVRSIANAYRHPMFRIQVLPSHSCFHVCLNVMCQQDRHVAEGNKLLHHDGHVSIHLFAIGQGCTFFTGMTTLRWRLRLKAASFA